MAGPGAGAEARQEAGLKDEFPRAAWAWAASLFLAALGAKWWLVRGFGSPLPFWDEWDVARTVLLPWLGGHVPLSALLAPHNEHRILWTRLYDLALLAANGGRWDARLEMAGSAAVHCAALAGLGWLFFRRVAGRGRMAVWAALFLAAAEPFGWENTLCGFQSQFAFLVALSLPALAMLGGRRAWTAGWWAGAACASAALFTVASGFLAATAAAGLALARAARTPGKWRGEAPTAATGALITAAGLWLKADVPHHHALRAQSVGDFAAALGANLAWPWVVVPAFALANLAPLAVLAWARWRKPDAPGREAAELALAVGLWAALQGAAAAYARGAGGRPPGWRYMDSSSLLAVSACLAFILLPVRRAGAALAWAWGAAALAGLCLLSGRAWSVEVPEHAVRARARLKYARAFVVSGDPAVFRRVPRDELLVFQGDPTEPPWPSTAWRAVGHLSDPRVVAMLPALSGGEPGPLSRVADAVLAGWAWPLAAGAALPAFFAAWPICGLTRRVARAMLGLQHG